MPTAGERRIVQGVAWVLPFFASKSFHGEKEAFVNSTLLPHPTSPSVSLGYHGRPQLLDISPRTFLRGSGQSLGGRGHPPRPVPCT